MKAPHHPIALDAVASNWDIVAVHRSVVRIGQVEVRAFPLHHPQGAFGFRLDAHGASAVYATDRELDGGPLDQLAVNVAKDTDVLIHDAQYCPEEYPSKEGWGHSTWAHAAAVAHQAHAKRLVLFHHDPFRDDPSVDAMVTAARSHFQAAVGAREGAMIAV
jgi:ribonuclease BN (tRNA processing enzyme)